MENGRPSNGKIAIISFAGLGGISGFLSALAFIVNLWVAPVEKAITRLELDVARINNLAAERGIAIPRLQADLARLETKLDRLEQQQGHKPP